MFFCIVSFITGARFQGSLCKTREEAAESAAGVALLQMVSIVVVSPGYRERSGSVVECLTRDRRAAGSSLTGVTALWSLSKTHLS